MISPNTYIIVAENYGYTSFLQLRNEINWFFANNRCKTFKKLETAKKYAYRVNARIKNTSVHVIDINGIESISSSSINKYFDTERDVFVIDNHDKQ